MNYYDARKQATPGPYFYDAGLPGLLSSTALGEAGWDEDSNSPLRANVTVVETLGSCGGDDPSLDMALLAHCFNHFDELLAFATRLGKCSSDNELHDLVVNNINDLITKAEEVKI